MEKAGLGIQIHIGESRFHPLVPKRQCKVLDLGLLHIHYFSYLKTAILGTFQYYNEKLYANV